MDRLKRRAEFKAVAKGARAAREAFTLQANRRGDNLPARIGFTVTKKTGNAVVRNRIKRRLRALCEQQCAVFAPGMDYVIVAREGALRRPFEGLASDLVGAINTVSQKLERGVGTKA